MTVIREKSQTPRVINRIITRGMGGARGSGRASLVVWGGGGFRQVIEYVKRKAGDGVKYVKDGIDEIIVWAKLVRINDEKPKVLIQGLTRAQLDSKKKISVKLSERISMRARKAWEDIKITIRRVK